MRVTVIGTSNSIMKAGWTRAAKDIWTAEGTAFHNLSIGGSSGRYAAFLLQDQPDIWQSDRIIIESAINDQMFITARIAAIDHAVASYAAILRQAHELNALDRLRIVLFPRQSTEAGCESDALIARLAAMFDYYDVDYIDLRPHLAQWASARGDAVRDTHSDANHVKPGYQDLIAELVTRHPAGPRRLSEGQIAARAGLDRMRDLRLRRLTVVADAPVETVSVGTSIQCNTVLRLQDGQSFRVTGAKFLVGAFVWTQATSGGLVFGEGHGARRLNLRRYFENIFLFDTFFRVLPLGDGAGVQVSNDAAIRLLGVLGLRDPDAQIDGATVEFVALVGADADPVVLATEVRVAMLNLKGVRKYGWWAMRLLHMRVALPVLRQGRRLFRAKQSLFWRK